MTVPNPAIPRPTGRPSRERLFRSLAQPIMLSSKLETHRHEPVVLSTRTTSSIPDQEVVAAQALRVRFVVSTRLDSNSRVPRLSEDSTSQAHSEGFQSLTWEKLSAATDQEEV